jgi:chromosome segregation ATPase
MDINALARMLEWMDEERRKDKQTMIAMEERLQQQADVISSLQRRLGGIESDQSSLRQQSMPAVRENDLIEQVRTEMRSLLETTETRRLNADREVERLRNIEREGTTRSINQLSEQLDKLQKIFTTLPDVKNEGQRVADMLIAVQLRLEDLTKKFEEPERRLALVEEQRRQEQRRFSQIESDYDELRKQVENSRTKIPLIEDLTLRLEQRIKEIQLGEMQRREQIQNFSDQQTLLIQQRDQQIDSLLKRFNDQESELGKNMERLETWSQTHREMRRLLDDFERISDRLDRRIGEVAEMQRLSEERFRTEWNGYKDDDQKKWKQATLSADEIWRNHDREFELYVKRLQEIEHSLPGLLESIKRLWTYEKERSRMYQESYQRLMTEGDITTLLPNNIPTPNGTPNGNGSRFGNGE